MLISGQVSDEILLEALYQEFYTEVFRLSLASLDHHNLALRATQAAFASAIVNRYRYKEDYPIRFWFLQISLETITKIYHSLDLKRTINANLPLKSEANLFGDTIPASYWDAEIWLTLDQLDFDKRLLALSLYYFQWSDKEIIAIFKIPAEDLDLNKRYLNSVLLPFRMEKSEYSNKSLKDRIIQSLALRWPESSLPAIDPELFIRQVAHQIRISRIKNRLSVSSKEIFLTTLIILLSALSIWGYNHYFPEEIPATPEQPTDLVYTPPTPIYTRFPMVQATFAAREIFRNNYFSYTVRPGDSLMSIARQFNISYYGLRRINRIPGGTDIQPGQKLWLISDESNPDQNISTYLKQLDQEIFSQGFVYLEPHIINSLATVSPMDSVLWLEGFLVDYGPEGYIGPPKIEFVQAWLTPEAALYLIGNLQQELQEVWLLTEHYQYMATPGLEQPWAYAWKPVNLDSQYLNSLILFSDTLSGKSSVSPAVMEFSNEEYTWNGRKTTAYNIKDINSTLHEKHWVDDETKINVRRQILRVSGGLGVLKEVLITKLEAGPSAPAGLLDARIPWRGGFALNYLGQPAPQGATITYPDQLSPPQRIENANPLPTEALEDFSRTRLTLQYPQILPETHQIPVEIFIDRQYLGTASLGNPWTMICDRSPDGSMMAYVSQPDDIPNLASQLNLVDLSDPESSWNLLPFHLGVKMFAFSPDSKHLAVFGYPGRFVEGTLIVVDIASRSNEWNDAVILDHLGEASSLAWSPDGQQIALIARYQNSTFLEEVFIYDVNTGEIIRRHPLDFANPSPVHWPTEDWGIDFPVEMGGISDCVAFPAEVP